MKSAVRECLAGLELQPAHVGVAHLAKAAIAQDKPSAALTLDELFSEKAGHLIDHPQLGRLGRVVGTRDLVAHPNYILVYDVTADTVRVLRVLHAARQWPPQKGNQWKGEL